MLSSTEGLWNPSWIEHVALTKNEESRRVIDRPHPGRTSVHDVITLKPKRFLWTAVDIFRRACAALKRAVVSMRWRSAQHLTCEMPRGICCEVLRTEPWLNGKASRWAKPWVSSRHSRLVNQEHSLTLRTFHVGGTASSFDENQNLARQVRHPRDRGAAYRCTKQSRGGSRDSRVFGRSAEMHA